MSLSYILLQSFQDTYFLQDIFVIKIGTEPPKAQIIILGGWGGN